MFITKRAREDLYREHFSVCELLCREGLGGGNYAAATDSLYCDYVVARQESLRNVYVEDSKVDGLVRTGRNLPNPGSVDVNLCPSGAGDVQRGPRGYPRNSEVGKKIVGIRLKIDSIPREFIVILAERCHGARGPDVFLRQARMGLALIDRDCVTGAWRDQERLARHRTCPGGSERKDSEK